MENPSDAAAHELQLSYRLLFERNPLPMWVYDAQTLGMLAVNHAALAQYGYSQQEFVGLTLLDLHPDDDAAQLKASLQLPLQQQSTPKRWRHRRRSGDLLEVETVTEKLEFDGVHAHVMLVKDVTGQHLAEQRLREEHAILAAVINASNDAIVIVDREGRIKMFSPGAERIFRRTRSSMEGQAVEVLLPERLRATHAQHCQRFAAAGGASRMMGLGLVKGLRSDGQEIDLEGVISQVSVQQQPVLIASLRDVTARVRLDAEFTQSRVQLSELTQKLMQQEKMLVKRLAQALHDHLGQTIAAIRMVHETILAMQTNQTSAGMERLQAQLGTLIGQAIGQVRQVLVDLRPPLLEEHGLVAALDNELRNRALTHPQVDIAIEVPPQIALLRWPSEVEYVAFMVAREAVENALRHSQASAVAVRLTGSATTLTLEVADNGVGIPAGAAPRTGHLGILSMHERANAVGARVMLDTGTDQGTGVTFRWESSSHWEPSI